MEHKELMQRAANEIQELRREREILSAKVQTMEVFAAALGFKPSGGMMAPDILYELRHAIELADRPKPTK